MENKSLEELEYDYFILKMQDYWNEEDYRYANELKERIKRLKGIEDDE